LVLNLDGKIYLKNDLIWDALGDCFLKFELACLNIRLNLWLLRDRKKNLLELTEGEFPEFVGNFGNLRLEGLDFTGNP
jgi:hypothetical protein